MAKSKCKINYKQGFNATKKYIYNSYISFLFNEAISSSIQGTLGDSGIKNFISLGSPIPLKTSNILYEEVYNNILDKVLDKAEVHMDVNLGVRTSENLYMTVENFWKHQLGVVKKFYENEEVDGRQSRFYERQLDLIYILENFEDFKDENKSKSKLTLEDLEDDDNFDNNKDTESERFKDSISTSVWDRGDFNLKNLFLAIPKVNKNGEALINTSTGLPILIDGISLYNNLSKDLSGSPDYNTFWDKINSKEFQNKYPELKYVLKFLPDLTQNYNNLVLSNAIQLKVAFYQTFNKVYIPLVGLVKEKDGTSSVRNFVATRNTIVRNKWANNFKDQKPKGIIKSLGGLRSLTQAPSYEPTSERRTDVIKAINKYLKVLGIELESNIFDSGNNLTIIQSLITNEKTGLDVLLKDYFKENVSKGDGIPDFINFFYKIDKVNTDLNPNLVKRLKIINSKKIKIKNIINELVEIESQFSRLQLVLVHKNPNGDLQSVISERNSFTLLVNYINSAKNINELYNNIPTLKYNIQFQPGSFWYNSLFDNAGNKIKNSTIEFLNNLGYENKTKLSDSVVTVDMNEKEKLIYELNMLNSNVVDMPRTSTSDTYYAIRLKSYGTLDQNIFEKTMLNYLMREVEAVKSKKQDSFYIFRELLSDDLKKELLSNTESTKQTIINNKNSIIREINLHFKKTIDGTEFLIKDLKVDSNDIKPYSKEIMTKLDGTTVDVNSLSQEEIMEEFAYGNAKTTQIIDRAKILNSLQKHFINAVESAYLFSGNPAGFKDFTKRFKGGLSTGNPADSNKDVEALLNSPSILANKYSIAQIIKDKKGDTSPRKSNDKTFFTKTFKDDIDTSKKVYNLLLSKLVKGVGETAAAFKERVKDYKKVLTPYEKIDVSDGQAMANLDFYREFLMKTANWSEEKELTIEYEGLIFKEQIYKQKLSKAEKDRFDYLHELVYSDDDRYTLAPIKGQYSGYHANIEASELAMDKMSIVPMLPSVAVSTNNKKWIKAIINMAENDIAYSKYKSVSKGHVIETSNFNEGFNDLSEHFTPFLKEQIRTSSEFKTLVSWGVQFRKLLFSTLFNNAKSNPAIQKLHTEYLNILKDIADDAKETLNVDLGAHLDIEKGTVIITDFSKLVTALKRQGESMEVSSSIIDSIEYNEDTGELLNPFETTGANSIITNMLFGMIDRKLRGWKAVGNQYIQMSNSTFSALDFYDQVENNKKELKTTRAHCRLTFKGEYRKLLNLTYYNNPIGTLENLNKALLDPKWRALHKKELTIVGYRIPTADTNFMEYLEIVQFLPPQTGNVIQLYNEITAKSGADFDIDKLNIFLPTLGKNGKFIEYIKGEKLNSDTLKQLKKEKNDKITETNRILNSLRQEKRDISTLNDKELKKYYQDVENLRIEGEIYRNLIQLSLEEANISLANLQFERRNKSSISNLINDIFDNPETLDYYRHKMDSEVLSYFEISFEFEKTLKEISFNKRSMRNIKFNIEDQIYDLQEQTLSEYFILTENFLEKTERLKNKRGILTNKMLEIYSDIFSQPETFAQLVKPNDSSYVNSVFEKNFSQDPNNKGKQKESGLPSGTKIFEFLTNLKLHKQLGTSKKHIAIYATTNTSHVIATQYGLDLNPYYWHNTIIKGEENSVLKKITLGLLNEEERKLVSNKDGSINLASDTDVLNSPYKIQNIIAQLLDVSVDGEKNPKYAYANINDSNINLVLYLLRQRVPFERIVSFISLQPIKAYFKSKEIKDRDFKPAIPDRVWNGQYDLDVNRIEEQLINPNDGEFLAKAYFTMLALQIEANVFRNFTSQYNYDTNKINTPMGATQKQLSLDRLIRDKLITEKSIDTWEHKTIVSVFNNNNYILKLSEQVFPILFKKELVQKFSVTLSLAKVTPTQRISLERIMLQEYMGAVYDQFGEFNGQKFGDYALELMYDPELLYDIKELGDKLKNFSIFSQITSETIPTSTEDLPLYTLRVIRDINNKGQQVNVLSEEIETLLNFDESEDEEFNNHVRDTFTRFCLVAIKQGFSKSRFFMEDIVPLSFKQDIYFNAIENYQAFLSEDNKIPEVTNNLDHFYSLFSRKFLQNYLVKYFSNQTISEYTNYSTQDFVALEQDILGGKVNLYTNDNSQIDPYTVMTPEMVDKINDYLLVTLGKKTEKDLLDEKLEYEKRPVFNSLPSVSKSKSMTYAGIGSRQTPKEVLALMTKAAKMLEGLGFTLNTGVTFDGVEEGADQAFSLGATKKNLFAPENATGKEITIASEIHPAFNKLSERAIKLMARNTNQIFGENLDTPVDFVLFYANETNNPLRPAGGTGQAVEMARRKGIPTINMADNDWEKQLGKILKTISKKPINKEIKSNEKAKSSVEIKANEIIKNENGLVIIKNALDVNTSIDIVNKAKDLITQTSFKQTGGSVSWGWGHQWMRISAMTNKQLQGLVIGKQLNGLEITQKIKDDLINGLKPRTPLYGYTPFDLHGNKLPNIPSEIIQLLKDKGIDISQYDASYNSVYDKTDNGSLIIHQDNTENNTSPIITISLGRPMKFITYELKDDKDFNIADTNNTAFRIAMNAVKGSAEKLNLIPKDAYDKQGNLKYGHLTPFTALHYAEQIDKANGTKLKDFVTEKLKEQFKDSIKTEYNLENGAILVFSGKNRNVLHEIVFDKEANQLPMPEGFPELIINKSFKGLGHSDKLVKTKNYRVVLTLRKVEGDPINNNINIGKLINLNKPREETIYSQLGNKTKSDNVVIKPWKELKDATKAITPEGIISTRIKNSNEHFGNPFSHDLTRKTQGLIKTETIKEAVEKYISWVIDGYKKEIKGINISSKSTDNLGKKLTNPNWYAKDLMDVETPYKANASKIKAPQLNAKDALKYDMNLMYTLQLQKFQKNPELIEEINARGGLQFILNSDHIVGTKNSRWEGKGTDSNFIKVLAQSYTTVAKKLNKFQETLPLEPQRREWIREQLKSGNLKGKPILYYVELGEPTHVTALDYLINKSLLSKKQIKNQIPEKNATFADNQTGLKKGEFIFYGVNVADANEPIEYIGKRIVIPGFEDLQLAISSKYKVVTELKTGAKIPTNNTIIKEIKEELLNLFQKHDIRKIISEFKHYDFNNHLLENIIKIDKKKTKNC